MLMMLIPRRILSSLLVGLFAMLAVAGTARGQAHISRDSARFVQLQQEPREIVPLESLIQYPESARRRGIEGRVVVEALIDTEGTVTKVVVLKSDDPSLKQEAIRAMKSKKFSPAMQNGTPVKIWITRTIHFRLNGR